MRKFFLALVALVGMTTATAIANYAMTQGAGTTFGSTVVGGIHYVQMFLCDLTTPAQCASVSAGGAVKVDGSAVTQPVSAASLPLPTGASTSAKQPALGTAGTASTDVLTVQGIASMTALKVDGAGGTFPATQSGTWNITNVSGTVSLPTGASTAANQTSVIGPVGAGSAAANALLTGSIYNSTPITLTNGQSAALQSDANGYLKVNIATGGGSGGTSSTFGAAFPATGTAAGMSQGGNMVALTGTGGALNVQCANCSGSGVSTVDEATFTAGTSLFAGTGGFFQTTATNNALTNGQQGMWQMTANRAGFVNLRTGAGVETGIAAAPLQVSLANTAANATAVKVDGSAVTQPVSGTVAATQSGAWTVLPGNTANTTAWLVTGTGGTFPATQSGTWNITNVSGTVSLPTGASTSALQPSNSAIGATTSGQTGTIAMGAVTTAAPTYTTAQTNPLSLTTGGALRVDASASTQPVSGTVTANQGGAPWTVTGTGTAGSAATGVVTIQGIAAMTKLLVTPDSVALPANQSVNVAQINGVTPLMGNGATGTGSPRVTIASDGTAISTTGYMSVKIDQTTPGTTNNVTVASNTAPVSTMNSASASAGTTAANAYVFDDTSPTAITENSFGYGRMSANRNQYHTLRDAAGNERGQNVNANNAAMVAIDQTTAGTTNGVQDAATGSTGATIPTKAGYVGFNSSGATGGQLKGGIMCDNHVFKHITTATDTLAVQGVASQTIYICGWRSRAAGTATWYLENTASANANCSSTLTQITGVASEVANSGEVAYNPLWGGLKNTSGNGLCINSTGTGGVDVDIWYTQF